MKTFVISLFFINFIYSSYAEEWKNYYNSTQINCALLDGEIIWIGTKNGLLKYNNILKTQEKYTSGNSLLMSNVITVIKKAPDGSIWIGTEMGLLRYFEGNFQVFFPSLDCPVDDFIYDLCFDNKGNLWLATNRGVAIRKENRFEHKLSLGYSIYYQIHLIADDVFVMVPNKLITFNATTNEINIIHTITFSYPDKIVVDYDNNILWYILTDLYKYDLEEVTRIEYKFLYNAKIAKGNNTLLLYKNNMIVKYDFDTEEFEVLSTFSNSIDIQKIIYGERLLMIYQDLHDNTGNPIKLAIIDDDFANYQIVNFNNGNTDFNTNNIAGVMNLDRNRTVIDQDDGVFLYDIPNWKFFINSILGVDRNLSFIDNESNYYHFSGRLSSNEKYLLTRTNFINPYSTIELLPLSYGEDYTSLLLYNNAFYISIKKDEGFPPITKHSLYKLENDIIINMSDFFQLNENKTFGKIISNGDLLIFDYDNKIYFNNESENIKTISIPWIYPDSYAKLMHFDNNSHLWFVSNFNRLYKLEDVQIYNIDYSHIYPKIEIVSIKTDEKGNLWLGTDIGLLKFDGYEFKLYNTANSEILSNNINDIDIDENNNIWIGTDMGLSIFNENKIILNISPNENNTNTTQIETYPNPFTDNLTIKLNNNIDYNFELLIFSNNGELVFQKNIYDSSVEFNFDLGILHAGSFMLIIKSAFETITHKIVKVQ